MITVSFDLSQQRKQSKQFMLRAYHSYLVNVEE